MKQFAFFSLFLLPFISFGQLKPFEDYEQCLIGLKLNGRIIFEPQFEEIEDLYDSQYKGYFAKKDGLWGYIDGNGKYVFGHKYLYIKPFYNTPYYFASADGKSFIITLMDEVIRTMDYDDISILSRQNAYDYRQLKPYYLVEKNGLTGVLNEDFVEVIPPEYSQIEYVSHKVGEEGYDTYRYGDPPPYHIYFRLTNPDKANPREYVHGVANEEGKVIIPATNTGYPEIADPGMQFCEHAEYYYKMENPDGGYLFDSKGKKLVGPVQAIINLTHNISDSCNAGRTDYAILDWNEGMSVVNLATLKESQRYEYIVALENCFLYQNEEKWGILNSDFSVRAEKLDWEPQLSEEPFTRELTGNRGSTEYLFPGSTSVFIISPIPTKKQLKQNSEIPKALYNIEKDIKTPYEYNNIEMITSSSGTAYWAYNQDGNANVYNGDLVKTSPALLDLTESIPEYWHPQDTKMIICKKAGENLFGAVDIYGQVQIPFSYISLRDEFAYGLETYWYVGQISPGLFELIDHKGQKILDQRFYERISLTDRMMVYKTPDGAMLVEFPQNVLERNAQGFWKGYMNYQGKGKQEALFMMKDSMVSVRMREQFVPFTPEYYVDGNSQFQVFDSIRYQLDENGKATSLGKLSLYTETMVGGLKFLLFKSKLEVYDSENRLTVSVENFVVHKAVYNEGIYITTGSGKGILNSKTGKWILEPKFTNIEAIHDKTIVFWGRIKQSDWMIFDVEGNPLSTLHFDFPVATASGNAIFCTNGEFGVLDQDHKVIIMPVYNSIVEVPGGYALHDNRGWGFWHDAEVVIKPQFSDFSVYFVNSGIAVFQGDNMAILNSDLEYIIPLTPVDDLRKNYDLKKIFYSTGKESSEDFRTLPNDIQSLVGNVNLLEILKLSNTCCRNVQPVFENRRVDGSLKQQYGFIPEETYVVTTPVFSSKRYYSQRKEKCTLRYREFASGNLPENDRNYLPDQYELFFLDSSGLRRLKFEDLFISGSDWKQHADSLMTDLINKQQTFGLSCVDLPRKLNVMKQNACIVGPAFQFHEPQSGRFVAISIEKFKDYLKFPEEFGF